MVDRLHCFTVVYDNRGPVTAGLLRMRVVWDKGGVEVEEFVEGEEQVIRRLKELGFETTDLKLRHEVRS